MQGTAVNVQPVPKAAYNQRYLPLKLYSGLCTLPIVWRLRLSTHSVVNLFDDVSSARLCLQHVDSDQVRLSVHLRPLNLLYCLQSNCTGLSV